MGKSLLELFENKKIGELYTLSNTPLEVKGETAKERYDIKNSKDIRVSSSSPLLKLSFGALNAIRLGTGGRKSETFLEEEISGNRILRTLSLPILYGTDIIRLTTESTSVVEKMKNSANGGEGSGFSKFGQKIQATRDRIANSKVLGLPKPLNPTEYYTQFNEKLNPVYDRMIKINEIKENAAGTEFGKILKNSAGTPSGFGKQVLGNSLALAKKELKKKILGVKGQSINGNNDFSNLNDQDDPYVLYSQYENERYSTGKASQLSDDANFKYNIKDKYNRRVAGNNLFPNITNDGQGFHSKTQYSARLENFDDAGKNGNKELNKYNLTNKFSKISSYTNVSGDKEFKSGKAGSIQDRRYSVGRNNLVENFDWRENNLVYIGASKDESGKSNENYFGTLKEQYDFISSTFNFPYQKTTGQIFGKGIEYLENGPYVIGKDETSVDESQAKRAYGFRQYYYSDLSRTRNLNGVGKFGKAAKELDPAEPSTDGSQKSGLGADKVFTTITKKPIDVNKLRPAPLNYKQKQDRPSYSKRKSDFYNSEGDTINGSLLDTRESRGFSTERDVLNQLGVLSKNDLEKIKINKKSLEKIDFIPVRFQRVNDSRAIYMSATVNSFQETFSPSWEGKQMMGNPFKFYTYSAIERKVSFNLKVYALSQLELIMMWERLDHLAHLVYPFSVSTTGVSPTLIYFTMGNLYIDKPAIVESLTFSIEDNENLWEIGGTDAKIRKNNFESGLKGKVSLNANKIGVESGTNGMINSTYRYTINSNQQVETDLSRDKAIRVIESEENKGVNNNPDTKPDGVNAQSKIWFEYLETQNKKRVSMDTYKVPKIINVQVGLIFLESAAIVNSKLYSVGNPITLTK